MRVAVIFCNVGWMRQVALLNRVPVDTVSAIRETEQEYGTETRYLMMRSLLPSAPTAYDCAVPPEHQDARFNVSLYVLSYKIWLPSAGNS